MDIKEQIQSKFISVKNFMDKTGLKYSTINKAINGYTNEAVEVLNLVETTEGVERIKWTAKLTKQVRKAIYDEYSTQANFADATGINRAMVSYAFNGDFKEVKNKAKEILDALNIDYEK